MWKHQLATAHSVDPLTETGVFLPARPGGDCGRTGADQAAAQAGSAMSLWGERVFRPPQDLGWIISHCRRTLASQVSSPERQRWLRALLILEDRVRGEIGSLVPSAGMSSAWTSSQQPSCSHLPCSPADISPSIHQQVLA